MGGLGSELKFLGSTNLARVYTHGTGVHCLSVSTYYLDVFLLNNYSAGIDEIASGATLCPSAELSALRNRPEP